MLKMQARGALVVLQLDLHDTICRRTNNAHNDRYTRALSHDYLVNLHRLTRY